MSRIYDPSRLHADLPSLVVQAYHLGWISQPQQEVIHRGVA